MAIALFVTTVTFEDQILVKNGQVASSWEVTIGVNNSHALMAAMDAAAFE